MDASAASASPSPPDADGAGSKRSAAVSIDRLRTMPTPKHPNTTLTTSGSSADAFHVRFAEDATTATQKRARPAVDRDDIALITPSYSLSPQAASNTNANLKGLQETPVVARSFSDLFPSQPSAPSDGIDVSVPLDDADDDAESHDDADTHEDDLSPNASHHETPDEGNVALGREENEDSSSNSPSTKRNPKRKVALPLVPFADIPPRQRRVIEGAMGEVYGIDQPRSFQIEAINHCTFNDDVYIVLQLPTAGGKSIVPLATTLIKCGVGIVVVPLIGLGSDQVEKVVVLEHNAEAYHFDELKGKDAQHLADRLLSLTDEEIEHVAITAIVSPQIIMKESPWLPVFKTLASRGHLSLFCIDEAHNVQQCGRSFRPAFKTMLGAFCELKSLMPRPIPRILMSVSILQSDIDVVSDDLQESREPTILHGSLARRGTTITCHVSGDPSKTLKASSERDLIDYPRAQQIWYTNSKAKAEGSLLDSAQTLVENNAARQKKECPTLDETDGVTFDPIAHSFTGADGTVMKTWSMFAFTSFGKLISDTSDPIQQLLLLAMVPIVQILTATSAENCGISSDNLMFGKHIGLVANLYDVLQEMGRVNRRTNATAGTNTYEVHISFNCIVSLFRRIFTNKDASERAIQRVAAVEVLAFLVTPKCCYHTYLENFFEYGPARDRPDCGNFCSYCLGHIPLITGVFVKQNLISFLSSFVAAAKSSPKCNAFIKAMKEKKQELFADGHVPEKFMGPIHGLALQLLARGIIDLEVAETDKIGTDKLLNEHFVVALPNAKNDDGTLVPAYIIPGRWNGLNYK